MDTFSKEREPTMYTLTITYGDKDYSVSGNAEAIWHVSYFMTFAGLKNKVVDHNGTAIDISKGIAMEPFSKHREQP